MPTCVVLQDLLSRSEIPGGRQSLINTEAWGAEVAQRMDGKLRRCSEPQVVPGIEEVRSRWDHAKAFSPKAGIEVGAWSFA